MMNNCIESKAQGPFLDKDMGSLLQSELDQHDTHKILKWPRTGYEIIIVTATSNSWAGVA